MKRPALGFILAGVFLVMAYSFNAGCSTLSYEQSPQYHGGKFRNPARTNVISWNKATGMVYAFLYERSPETVPDKPIPVVPITRDDLLAAPDNTLYRLGHSSLLFKLNGQFWMTDPVFSERASPSQWVGPKRFHQTPISIAELPSIKAVMISHDHYDHLDKNGIIQLAEKVEHFLVPLGVSQLLTSWGIDPRKVQEFDWWQGTQIHGVQLIATPAQHFSGRGIADGNKRLWASWTILGEDVRLFFSGDTGYFDGFKEIARRYGPFDVTFVETGAYNKLWADIHMLPEHSVQAHIDLQGKWMFPIHNGTFDLSLHAWYDPFEQVSTIANKRGVNITTPIMGEPINLKAPPANSYWWQPLAFDDAAMTEGQL